MPFADGDDYHPASNVEKMSAGEPLNDADREPWLDALNALMRDSERAMVISCSALRESYRERVAQAINAVFVYLDVSEEAVLERVKKRDHFFPESLVRDQFDVLEVPSGQSVIHVDAHKALETIVKEVCDQLAQH